MHHRGRAGMKAKFYPRKDLVRKLPKLQTLVDYVMLVIIDYN